MIRALLQVREGMRTQRNYIGRNSWIAAAGNLELWIPSGD